MDLMYPRIHWLEQECGSYYCDLFSFACVWSLSMDFDTNTHQKETQENM